jgi:hypothetical protein
LYKRIPKAFLRIYYVCAGQTHAHRHSKNAAVTAGKGSPLYLMGGVKRNPDSHVQPVLQIDASSGFIIV